MVRTDDKRQREALLILILSFLVRVAGPAGRRREQEQNLRDPFTRVDLGWQGGRIANLDRHSAAPFRLQRRHIDNDAAAGIGRLTDANGYHVARNLQVFHRLRQRKAVGRNQAEIAFDIHERSRVEVLWIDDRAMSISEDFETPADPDVVAIAGYAIRD